MKTKLYNYLLLLSGAVLLTGCPPPEQTDPELNNQFSFGGQIYNITAAGTSVDEHVYLGFESGEDTEVYFTLHLDEGVFRITESGTFTFDAKGNTGTFSKGWFESKTAEATVISGTVIVEVLSGNRYTVKADCKCDDGKELIVRYTGALDYDGPVGTTTFSINGVAFPYAYAWMESVTDEDYGYVTSIAIEALDGAESARMLECELFFFHSNTSPAGTYTCTATEPPGAGFVVGELDADLSKNESIGGYLSAGTITVGIEGDVYTIAFEDVKIDTGGGLVDVTGTYTGTMLSVDE